MVAAMLDALGGWRAAMQVRLLIVIATMALTGCGQHATVERTAQDSDTEASASGVENLIRVSDLIYSGGQPHGPTDFEMLVRLGIKTIVSVDGARPDVEAARAAGLQYVHIPVGYDGIDAAAGQMLARLVREAEGPFFIHCHHGVHRGPAAAAIAAIAEGTCDGESALAILHRAGTSHDYPGLWRDVESYMPPEAGTALPELVEVAEVGSLVAAMAAVDRAFDHLKLCQQAGWQTPPDHADVTPQHEALLLREGFYESARGLAGAGDAGSAVLEPQLRQAEEMAQELQHHLAAGQTAAADEQLARIEKSCRACHRQFRDGASGSGAL